MDKPGDTIYIQLDNGDRVIIHSWTRGQGYYIQLNKVTGLLNTEIPGDRVIIYLWTRRQGYYIQLEAGFASLGRNSLSLQGSSLQAVKIGGRALVGIFCTHHQPPHRD